ncbi:hypothetical protein GCM10025734_10550 [Kitasatospora paranensis]|uniref:HdeD family acid-resistance protein n=1 Tax=Kitasatospora paranensis TaxID=258053 RepID=UPI0031F14496
MTTPTSSPLSTEPEDVLAAVGRSWRWPLAFGILTVLAGIVMLSWPEETVRVVAIIIGLQLLVAGVVRFVTAFTHDRTTAGEAAPCTSCCRCSPCWPVCCACATSCRPSGC